MNAKRPIGSGPHFRHSTNSDGDVCPYLRLENDRLTAAAYPRLDHSCALLGAKRISPTWQQDFCIGSEHVNCPYYLGKGRLGQQDDEEVWSTHDMLVGWRTAAIVGLVFLVVTGTALTVYAGLVDRGAGTSPEVAAPVVETAVPEQSTSTSVPAPAATPQTGGSDDIGGVDEAPPEPTNQVAYSFAHDAFESLWERTDVPVREMEVDRTWIWGAEPLSPGMSETWEEAPDGERLVQYFEKGRMELDTEHEADETWYVTSGLLATEMIEGYYQVGPDSFDVSPSPAEVPVAGDADEAGVPSYSEINDLGLTDAEPIGEPGDVITEMVIDGIIQSDDRLEEYEVTAAYFAAPTEHTIASVFWDFMNSQDTIYQDEEYITDDLFANPFHLIGYPITGAYWTTVAQEEEQVDVLWQCFERRCLTYTPDNEPGWRIESGDAGLHYYEWRYAGE